MIVGRILIPTCTVTNAETVLTMTTGPGTSTSLGSNVLGSDTQARTFNGEVLQRQMSVPLAAMIPSTAILCTTLAMTTGPDLTE